MVPEPLPRDLPDQIYPIMREELPSLIDEIVNEIRTTIPEYNRPLDGPYGEALVRGVERNVTGFVDWLAQPAAPLDRRDDICRKLGEFEAYEGRRLATLQLAYQIAALASWRRIVAVHTRYDASPHLIPVLADALLEYMAEAAALSEEGYQSAKAQAGELRTEDRRWLLQLIVERPRVTGEVLAEHAVTAGWTLPATMTMVALRLGAPVIRTVLDEDVLVDTADPEPYLLVPGPLTAQRREMLESALGESRAAAGLTMPLAMAADSLRWARQGLVLVDADVIGAGPLTLCEDHLVTLYLLADRPLLEQIAHRRLGPLGTLTKRQNARLTETLRAWLRTRGPATRIGADLGVHTQTVRYRMRQLELALGDDLTDPDSRFATEVVLRAKWLLERNSADAAPAN